MYRTRQIDRVKSTGSNRPASSAPLYVQVSPDWTHALTNKTSLMSIDRFEGQSRIQLGQPTEAFELLPFTWWIGHLLCDSKAVS
jgi:hypothetical protein